MSGELRKKVNLLQSFAWLNWNARLGANEHSEHVSTVLFTAKPQVVVLQLLAALAFYLAVPSPLCIASDFLVERVGLTLSQLMSLHNGSVSKQKNPAFNV